VRDAYDPVTRALDAGRLAEDDPAASPLECSHGGQGQTIAVDLAVAMEHAADRVVRQSRLELARLLHADPAHLQRCSCVLAR